MKKRMFGLVLAMSICCMSVPVCAKNNTDTILPSKIVGYGFNAAANTELRRKEDSSFHYIKNNSGFDLYVRSMNGALTVNYTNGNKAIVPGGQYFISNWVYERGAQYCKLNIISAKSGVTGRVNGLWSPDSVGSYPVVNPVS